jgi:hypothetical protein
VSAWGIPQRHVRKRSPQRQNRAENPIVGRTASRATGSFLTPWATEPMDKFRFFAAHAIRLKYRESGPPVRLSYRALKKGHYCASPQRSAIRSTPRLVGGLSSNGTQNLHKGADLPLDLFAIQKSQRGGFDADRRVPRTPGPGH